MALTAQDMMIMESLSTHPVIAAYTQAADWTAIAGWYEQVPNPSVAEAISYLSILDRAKFFSFVDFQKWYSDFNFKLHAGGGTACLGYSVEQIKGISTLLLIDLITYSLTEHSMQTLVTEMFSRGTMQSLFYLLVCLGCDEVLEQQTLSVLGIELGGVPRWQSIGLTDEPTYGDCQDIYSI